MDPTRASGPDARGPGPITLGTAGHVDHGKTALVRALTGVDTDRLEEEHARGMTIVLGYAPLLLASGRRVSIVDVPGHERFVRTMVAGATGIDAFVMVVAADDGVMPQTVEHAAVLRALDVRDGVVAVTKSDLADPARAGREAASLLPGSQVVACSALTGAGLDSLRAALDRLGSRTASRSASRCEGPRLHVDRSFTVVGRGTVLTGTLWSGEIVLGGMLELVLRSGGRREVRVRGIQVHDTPVERARAGQRVAVNLVGVHAGEAGRGDVLVEPGLGEETTILDCALEIESARHGERVQAHHGTRDVPGRICRLAEGLWQLRLERPLLALDGDHVVVRRLAPPETLGGGVVLDAAARRHGARPDAVRRLALLREGHDPGIQRTAGSAPRDGSPTERGGERVLVDPGELATLEQRLLEAGPSMLSEAQLNGQVAALKELRGQGRAIRVSGRLYAHPDVAADVLRRIVGLLEAQGSVTLAGVRDALGLSRKSSQAFLEHLDSTRVTRRREDDTRVLVRDEAGAAR